MRPSLNTVDTQSKVTMKSSVKDTTFFTLTFLETNDATIIIVSLQPIYRLDLVLVNFRAVIFLANKNRITL